MNWRSMRRADFLRGLLALALATAAPARAETPTVAAAASLRYALDEAADAFARAGGTRPRITYAASGNLVQQIRQGAPYGLFLSADEGHVAVLEQAGLTEGQGKVYAVGRLALAVPPGSKLEPTMAALKAGLADGRVRRVAIANPETAPYGARAVEALKNAGLWQAAQPRLVTGENIGQAFQFVSTGGADAGFVSLSLVLSPGFQGRYQLVPATLHAPLTQEMVLLKGAGPETRRFRDWLLGPAGAAVLKRHGYQQP